jgi:uncharacterized membrane protein YeaQ/YmgE (transglycosylase-associated protein family)
MTLLAATKLLPFGLLIGFLAHRLALGSWSGRVLDWMAVGAAGAIVGGVCDHLFGIWPDEGPQGFAMSLLGALAFVVAYFALHRARGWSARPAILRRRR